MEPMDLNGGRFYARPLHDDNRIDDRPALRQIHPDLPEDCVHHMRQGWASESMFSWAVCEQTNVDLLALATLRPRGDGTAELHLQPLPQPTNPLVEEAVAEGRATVQRWAENYLGLAVTSDA